MVRLDTLILSSDGRFMTPLGKFLYAGDRPEWAHTLTHEGERAKIVAATVVDADYLDREAIELTVQNREKAPLIGDEDTKVWSLEFGGWRRLADLRTGEAIRLPERVALGLIPTWARVKFVRKAEQPPRVWPGTPAIWGKLVLGPGTYSYATPSAFVRR